MTIGYRQLRGTTPAGAKKPNRTHQQKQTAAIGQQEATAPSLDQLRELAAKEGSLEDELDEPGPADDDGYEDPEDSDQDDRDDDETGDDPADDDWIGLPVTLAEQFAATPTLEPWRIYALRVQPAGPLATDQAGWRCEFIPPAWLSRALSRRGQLESGLRRNTVLLRALARWFETQQGAFLADPCPRRFVAGEKNFNRKPVVTQRGLLARIDESARVDKIRFSELANKIWLVWPDKSMPLRSLFTHDFQIAWVAQGCLFGLSPGDWRVFELPAAAGSWRARKEALEEKSFSGYSQTERLLFLCHQVKLAPEQALAALRVALWPAVPEKTRV